MQLRNQSDKPEGVMHLSESHLPKACGRRGLPKRFPVGATYVVEGSGGENGHLRVFSRYVVLPGGRRINLGANLGVDFGANFSGPASPRVRRRSPNRGESQAQNGRKRRPARAKKIMLAGGTTRQHRR
jgi:hypothetical protein